MKKPRFNELGVRTFPVATEEIVCGSFDENKVISGGPVYVASVQIDITLEDGRRFSKHLEVQLTDDDMV